MVTIFCSIDIIDVQSISESDGPDSSCKDIIVSEYFLWPSDMQDKNLKKLIVPGSMNSAQRHKICQLLREKSARQTACCCHGSH